MSSIAARETSVLYRNYVLFMLVLVNTINFVDRTAISVLSPSIQAEFGVSNTVVGAVMGTAFTIFYATLAFPIARLIDRRRRNALLALVLAIWSGMTALCGAAVNIVMLFLFRVGVGIGEAGAGPASHSLIADYFRKEDRPATIGFFSLGVPLGNFLGIVLGGLLIGWIGWRWTFVALGAPGVLLALIVWATVREPIRGGLDDAADAAALRPNEDIPVWEGIKSLWARPTFRVMSYSGALSALCGYGMNLWMPAFLQRVHDLTAAQYSVPLGTAIGVGGGLGAMLGGVITARAAIRNPRAFLTLPALNMVVFAAAIVVVVSTSSLFVLYSAVFVAAFTQFYLMGPYFAVVQRLAALKGRAVATAFFFFVLAMVGIGFGPLYIGIMNDVIALWFGDAEGLRWALATLPVISVIAAVIAFRGRAAIDRDADRIGGPIVPTGQ
jgi:predicted MFS family arabinose efflux permease